MAFRLTSSAFADGDPIPEHYTCEGQDISPPLAWTGTPDGTKSLALLCDDPDAPGGTFRHWGMYDIPADEKELPEAVEARSGAGPFRQVLNDFRRSGYGGPCPPKGHGTHRYIFRLLALSADRLEVGEDASCAELEDAARPHVVDETRLTGTFERG